MIGVNFIITCFDKEDFWPHLKGLILSYKEIIPYIAFCYNGNDKNLECDYRCENRGLQIGDGQLICGGYNHLKGNGINKWIKLSVDSWLCNERIILEYFQKMEVLKYHYMGCIWKNDFQAYSTDVIFADTYFMKTFVDNFKHDGKILEKYAFEIAQKTGGSCLIKERVVRDDLTRFNVPALGWTMDHDLQKNIEFLNKYRN